MDCACPHCDHDVGESADAAPVFPLLHHLPFDPADELLRAIYNKHLSETLNAAFLAMDLLQRPAIIIKTGFRAH